MTNDRGSARRSIGRRRNPASEAAVLDAARQVLAERGFGGFSIDEVARRAGAGKPTIYRWWPSRADLLASLIEGERRAQLVEPDSGKLADDLAQFARSTLAVWRETPVGEALRGLIAEAQSSEAALLVLWERVLPASLRPIRAMFGRGGRRGEVDPADIEILVELYSGFLLRRLTTGQVDDDRSGLERLTRIIATGRGRREGR